MPMISGSEDLVDTLPTDVSEVAWQRMELGSFSTDLCVWADLAAEHPGPILELGSGFGRVAFHLCGTDREVIAVESDRQLAEFLEQETLNRGVPLEVVESRFEVMPLPSADIQLVIAPMQFLHYLEPDEARNAFGRLTAGTVSKPPIGLAVMQDGLIAQGEYKPESLPDMSEVDGWVISSRISRVVCSADQVTIERQREVVSPDGERRIETKIEALRRYRRDEVEEIFDGIGYRLSDSNVLPEESGMTPSDLLLFVPNQDRSQS